MTFQYVVFQLPRMATETRLSYSYSKIEKNSVIKVIITAEKERTLCIEEHEDQTSAELTTQFFGVGELTGWKGCHAVESHAHLVKPDERCWCAHGE